MGVYGVDEFDAARLVRAVRRSEENADILRRPPEPSWVDAGLVERWVRVTTLTAVAGRYAAKWLTPDVTVDPTTYADSGDVWVKFSAGTPADTATPHLAQLDGVHTDGLAIYLATAGGSGRKDWMSFRHVGAHPNGGTYSWYAAGRVDGGSVYTSPNVMVTRQIGALPFLSSRAGTVDRFGVHVVYVPSAGGRFRLAVYKSTSDTNLYPDELVYAPDEFVVSVAQAYVTSPSLALEADTLYWFCWQRDEAYPYFQVGATDSQGVWPILGTRGEPDVYAEATPLVGWYVPGYAYGPFPATFPTGGLAAPAHVISGNNLGGLPLIACRYST